MNSIKLSNDYQIPVICYGTDIVSEYMINNRVKACIKNVIKKILGKDTKKYRRDKGIIKCSKKVLDCGCQFFDTSRAYDGSEIMLREALRGKRREEYYICTKLCNHDQLQDKPARQCLKESMERLGVEYVDLYLLHWPVQGKFLNYWRQLEELYEDGLVKAIGVSNCKIHHLEQIKKIATIMPMVNEVELHPLLSEVELRKYCIENNIQIMAYTSTARLDFRLKASRRMETVCKKHNKSLSQVILRWHIQNGIIPIFNSSSIVHLKENMNIFDFDLAEEDMKIIDSMNINSRTRYDSDNCEWDRL